MWTVDVSRVVTADQKQKQAQDSLVQKFERAVAAHLDATARERQYDNALSIATYVNSAIGQWAAEAQAFIAWRDDVWSYALVELDKALTGQRPIPSVEDFISELPEIVWPA